jgi:hypothetical protein
MHLEEKINLIKFRIRHYQKEKEDLVAIIESNNDEKVIKLVNEINGYKNMTDKCRDSCSKLTEEILKLKKEIEKFQRKKN